MDKSLGFRWRLFYMVCYPLGSKKGVIYEMVG